MTTALPLPHGDAAAQARLFGMQMRNPDVRLFNSAERTPCVDDPEMFFTPTRRMRAIASATTALSGVAADTTQWP